MLWWPRSKPGASDMNMYAILDLQFGSTGKGLIAGYLAKQRKPDAVVTAWAPNAGHTFIDKNGRKFVHTMLANGVVSPKLRGIYIGPGSVINEQSLYGEIASCIDILEEVGASIYVHEHAAVVTQADRDKETTDLLRIGSTMKGSAEAAIRKMRRESMATARERFGKYGVHGHPFFVISDNEYVDRIMNAETVQLEGAQGYSLSLAHGFYPHTTSRNCTLAALFDATGVPFFPDVEVIGTCRTYPIRVANRVGPNGEHFSSGPCYSDQKEINWNYLGVPEELTTVTKLPRRVFTWSHQQFVQAARQNGEGMVGSFATFLNFINYCRTESELLDIIGSIQSVKGQWLAYLGAGPTENDVYYSGIDLEKTAVEAWRESRARMV